MDGQNGKVIPRAKPVEAQVLMPGQVRQMQQQPMAMAPQQPTVLSAQPQMGMMQNMEAMQSVMLTNLISQLSGQVMQQMNQLSELHSQFTEEGQYCNNTFEWSLTIEEY